jgi:lysophospholipase L1-like esterase
MSLQIKAIWAVLQRLNLTNYVVKIRRMKVDHCTRSRLNLCSARVLALEMAFTALAVAPLSWLHAEETQRPQGVPPQAAVLAPTDKAQKSEKAIEPAPATARWQSSLESFAEADLERQPATDGVLFVGSSTIRLWSRLSQDFRQLPVLINRGFGGSTMADCNALARELVIQYKPKQILIYAGDNDLAEGRLPADVLKSFSGFVEKVRAALPDSHIAYISVKPSPARLSLLPQVRETNALISAYIKTVPNAGYIDTFSPMLGADGHPRPDLFNNDRLHLNEAGYQLWKSVILSHLPAPPPLQNAFEPETGPATASR